MYDPSLVFKAIFLTNSTLTQHEYLEGGMFPDELKIEVVSVYKKNDKQDKAGQNNYRIITILSNISKIYSQPAITCSKLTTETLEQRFEICSKLIIKTT